VYEGVSSERFECRSRDDDDDGRGGGGGC